MLKTITLVVGSMQENCYLLYDETSLECLIIDPGDEADFIEDSITKNDLKPKIIVATHGHFDHVLAALELKLAYKIPFLIHPKDQFLLNRADSSANYFLPNKNNLSAPADEYLSLKTKIKLGKEEIVVLETPGHTPGSVTFIAKKSKMAFIGDTYFSGNLLGEYRHGYSSKKDLFVSLKKIAKIGEVTLYPGHGDKIENTKLQSFLAKC